MTAINVIDSSSVYLPPSGINGMVFDTSSTIYVSTAYLDVSVNICQIYTINSNGKLTKFNISNVTMNYITGIAFDNSGNLYITDQGNNCIIKSTIINATSGQGSIFVPYSAGLNGPTDITFDNIGNLYIANTNENNIINGEGTSFHKNHPANLLTLCEDCHHEFHRSTKQHKKMKTSKGSRILVIE